MDTSTVLVRFAGIAKEFAVSSELDLGFITVKWYGAIIAFGFTLAVLFGGRLAHKWRINLDKMIDVLLFGTVGAVLGARLYYVAFEWDYYSHHLGEIFAIWNGGLAIYGGIIGGIIAGFIVCKAEKLNFYNLLDMVGMSLLIGQGIGRWGNYANQEAFGGFTGTDKWGMMSDKVASYIATPGVSSQYNLESIQNIPEYIEQNNLFVHPTFFYESVWCILGFFVLYIIMKKWRKFSGQLFLCYGIWYGIERAVVEGMRSDSLYIGDTGIRVSQLLSVGIVIACTALLVIKLIKYTRNPREVEGDDYFAVSSDKEYAHILKAFEKRGKRKGLEYKFRRIDNRLYITDIIGGADKVYKPSLTVEACDETEQESEENV